jgi:two-component system, chemotaxis family, protein-glutamate methylesterase/glutaminase
MPIRVLIVDDSATVRRILKETLAADPGIMVVGAAADPYQAREMIAQLQPDVITLDVEMPRMDGLTFLGKLMQHHPLPVVVISSLTEKGGTEAMRAFELGAVEVLCKPGSAFSVSELGPLLGRTIRSAAAARIRTRIQASAAPIDSAPKMAAALHRTSAKILAFGASTGGTEALATVFAQLPGDLPGTIVVQHMPPLFTTHFAQRLNHLSRMRVAEAKGGEELMQGLAYLAPGGTHLSVIRSGAKYLVQLRDGPPVHHQRPAVDVAFMSIARCAGANAVGVLMTGMGRDGADGLLAMRRAGAHTITQDQASCVVYGMPKAADEAGASCESQPLQAISRRVSALFSDITP